MIKPIADRVIECITCMAYQQQKAMISRTNFAAEPRPRTSRGEASSQFDSSLFLAVILNTNSMVGLG